MSALFPFRALRPAPAAAADVASVPYDVVSTDEARALARGNPLSFLRVTRAEIDLPPDLSPYDARVYQQAVANLEALKRSAPMLLDDEPSLYLYRLRDGAHEQTGIAGCFSVDEYDAGAIKKHEKTRKDKEDDRTRHMLELRAQTGVVFLTYRQSSAVDRVVAQVQSGAPLYDLTAPDGVQHTVWRVTGTPAASLVDGFAALPALYIADGHHRAASAARARASLAESGARHVDADTFIAVAFPDTQVRILPYNRVVRDLGGSSTEAFFDRIRAAGLAITAGAATPGRAGQVSVFAGQSWQTIDLPSPAPGTPRAEALDVELLHRHVLEPMLGIGDPRTDKRIDFVGGSRGTSELERLVTSGRAAVAFSMFPVSLDDLMTISDQGGIMPPKSTWFEPKLRDGLLVHLI
jgi:uncharacterized protein (DUF1015 family)